MEAFETFHVPEKQTAQARRMSWDHHFGLGLSKTRVPLVEVNSVTRDGE
jgi:hypothetical protein